MCNYIFGLDSKAFEDLSVFIEPAEHVHDPPNNSWILTKLLDFFPFMNAFIPFRYTNKESTDWFIEVTRQAVKARNENGIQREDYLNFILDLQSRKGLSLEDVAGHFFTFFLDGYETSGHYLSGGLSLLAKHPEVIEKLRDEISDYDEIDYDTLNQMPYLDNVFHGNAHLIRVEI